MVDTSIEGLDRVYYPCGIFEWATLVSKRSQLGSRPSKAIQWMRTSWYNADATLLQRCVVCITQESDLLYPLQKKVMPEMYTYTCAPLE